MAALTEWLDLGFHRKDLLTKLGTTAQLGVLITGPAGSGKAAVVEARDRSGWAAGCIRAWGPTIAGLEPTAAGNQLKSLLQDGMRGQLGVVLIEDVEAICPRERRRAAQVLLPRRAARGDRDRSGRGRLHDVASPRRSAPSCAPRARSTTS